jgi:zinc/manganese transport system substrate-binding protein/manganese/iron transport system substrate-binding protein
MPASLRVTRREGVIWLAVLTMSAVIPHDSGYAAQSATPALQIAASTPIFADIISRVGGERVSVWSVIPAGADPHTWEASAQDMARVGAMDAFVSMGANLEPFIEAGSWRRAVQEAGVTELVLADRLDLIAVDRVIDHGDHTHDLRGGDPHVWLDPVQGVAMGEVIAAFLAELDPAGAVQYEANAVDLAAELREIDAAYQALAAKIPADRRKLVVFHDAYTYLSARYGYEVVGVVLPNPDADPSAQQAADLVETIRTEQINVVFAEPQFSSTVLDAIAAEAGVEVRLLITDTLTDDVQTYPDLLRFNLRALHALIP